MLVYDVPDGTYVLALALVDERRHGARVDLDLVDARAVGRLVVLTVRRSGERRRRQSRALASA